MGRKLLALVVLVAALSTLSGCSKPQVKKVTMHWGKLTAA